MLHEGFGKNATTGECVAVNGDCTRGNTQAFLETQFGRRQTVVSMESQVSYKEKTPGIAHPHSGLVKQTGSSDSWKPDCHHIGWVGRV